MKVAVSARGPALSSELDPRLGRASYFVVVDTLSATDGNPHRYESLFHLDTGAATSDDKSLAVRTSNPDAGNLAIVPLTGRGLEVSLITPIAMEEGLRFAIREGGRTVGAGVITKILE